MALLLLLEPACAHEIQSAQQHLPNCRHSLSSLRSSIPLGIVCSPTHFTLISPEVVPSLACVIQLLYFIKLRLPLNSPLQRRNMREEAVMGDGPCACA